jgi:hypothetical protein
MEFQQICTAMEDPSTYSHPVSSVERRDTHISAVFLAGDWVYKLKKPVDLGFLDFTDLESRHTYCRQEVKLNRRLTEGVYQGVVAIVPDGEGSLSIVEDGQGRAQEAVEYGVKMRRLPDERTLQFLLQEHRIDTDQIRQLGRKLAQFYLQAERGAEIDELGNWDTVGKNVRENFEQTDRFAGSLLDKDLWVAVRNASLDFLERRRELFRKRVREGKVCDGHGDLRSEHVYFTGGIQIIDCIEFNRRFRYLDPASDLGFLHSDLLKTGSVEVSAEIIESYVAETDDLELYRLLDFYACYRAMVQTKVRCLRFEQLSDRGNEELRREIQSHLRLAFDCALAFSRPTLRVVCGLPATGKSTLAGRLSNFLAAPLHSSDEMRKALAEELPDRPEVTSFGKGLYRPEVKNQVYARLLLEAQRHLENRESVILDATYSKRSRREEVRRLAADQGANCVFLETDCSRETMERRLKQRDLEQPETKARARHLAQFLKSFEELEEIPDLMKCKVDTEGPVEESLSRAVTRTYLPKFRQVHAYRKERLFSSD